MSVKVFKVAEVLSGRVVVSKKTRRQSQELASVLTSLGRAEDAAPESGWSVEVICGSGAEEVVIAVPVECILSRADLKISEREPVFIDREWRVIFFSRPFFDARTPMRPDIRL